MDNAGFVSFIVLGNPRKYYDYIYSGPQPRDSIHTTNVELNPERPYLVWLEGVNSLMIVYMQPLGKSLNPKP